MIKQELDNFNKLIMKYIFKRCFDITSETHLTIRKFLNAHLNI